MRNEIEKLCETLERLEPMNCSVQGVVQKLRRILDADPVAKFEAMGYRVEIDWNPRAQMPVLDAYVVPANPSSGPAYSVEIFAGRKCPEQFTDAATRLLARIEAKGE